MKFLKFLEKLDEIVLYDVSGNSIRTIHKILKAFQESLSKTERDKYNNAIQKFFKITTQQITINDLLKRLENKK